MVAGTALLLAGMITPGSGLTLLPYPKAGGHLIVTGPCVLVRHPIYCGGLALACGLALSVRSWLTVGYVVSRNPMYLGVYATLPSSALYTLNPIAVAVSVLDAVVHHRIVLAEALSGEHCFSPASPTEIATRGDKR